MHLVTVSVTCLLVASLVAAEELPPNWWLITDEDPFAALQQELGDNIPEALQGGPVAAGAATAAAAGEPSSGASASAGQGSATASAGPDGATASAGAGGATASAGPGGATASAGASNAAPRPPPRFPDRFPRPPGSEVPESFPPPQSNPGRPNRPPNRQPGGGPIVFPTDRPLTENVESFRPTFGGECTCTHPTSCTGQLDAPQGKCPDGKVCCPPQHRYRPKCGQMTPQPRSAQSVRDSNAPWMAALLEKVPNGYIFVCGGSLINEQVVLTAARCVQRFEENKDSLVVRLGEKDILSYEEIYPPVEIAVKDVIIHANYSREQKYNDLALLFLREPAPLRPGLDTICVRQEGTDLRDCSIHSYGLRQTGSSQFDLRLREADQAPLPYTDCQRVLRGTRKGPFFQLHPSFQCTTSDVTCDLGEDRAGSPLTCPDLTRREHQLRGVVAWGVGCQSQQKPGVYTSVTEFYRWIDFQVTDYFGYIESAFGPFNQV
ncbi:serine protease 44-like [Amphibalanus amphitrite]|uniref:serine protease 44-like n=1 Tax=Amphibalanus amphitrite TaxID=1232801 RepID=UPI001C91B94F|nr:serine protease 44-like [Amphibalanus amphitrite]